MLLKGTLPTDPHYGPTLPLMGTTSPSSPLPFLSESTVDSAVLLTFLHGVALYYQSSGTASLEAVLRPYFDALKYSTSRTKFPDCDLSLPSSSYHLGWFTHYHSSHLTRSPHLLTQHFKSLAMAKSGPFTLSLHRKYLQSVTSFTKVFHSALPADPPRSLKDFKDLTSLSVHPSYAGVHAKSLQSGADSLDSFAKLTYESEDVTLRLPPPVPPSGPSSPTTPKRPASPALPLKAKSTFLKCPPTCLSPPCAKAEHSVRVRDQPCQLPGCPAPTLAHKTRTCMTLHDRDSTQALCATPVPFPYMPLCARSLSTPLHPARHPSRAHRVSCRLSSSSRAPSPPALPAVKLGTGASVFASPAPLSSDPTTPTHNLTEVSDGSHVPATGSSMVGPSPLLVAPSLSEALLPQSAVEARGALTVLLGGQLQLLSTATSQPLLGATRAASPVMSTSASSGEYFLPAVPCVLSYLRALLLLHVSALHPELLLLLATTLPSSAVLEILSCTGMLLSTMRVKSALPTLLSTNLLLDFLLSLLSRLLASTSSVFLAVSAALLLPFSSPLVPHPKPLLLLHLAIRSTLTSPSHLAPPTLPLLLVSKLLVGTLMPLVPPTLAPAVHSLF